MTSVGCGVFSDETSSGAPDGVGSIEALYGGGDVVAEGDEGVDQRLMAKNAREVADVY